ncbi:MAG: histidine kinase N-terminal 7TM domain-containing protein [Halobaculum sp.]
MHVDSTQVVYLVPFAVATVACLAALIPARRVRDADTRAGLVGLLLLSAAWAAVEGGRIVVSDLALGSAVYVAGLTVGFGTVFAWLYFVSAYTGRDYHRRRRLRLAGAGLYLSVVLLKLTNPIHGLYYAVSVTRVPFPHVVVSYGPLNWVILASAYALSGVGFVWLVRFFAESPWNTRTLAMLVGATALPVAGTVVGRVTEPTTVLALNYEPLGVAAFAVGTLFVVLDSFRATLGEYGGAIDRISDAVIVVDDDGIVRRTNATARDAFPALAEVTGVSLASALPAVADARESAQRTHTAADRKWLVRESPVTLGPHAFGAALVLTDVTELRRQQAELTRQNRQLERFTEAITHELRNGLAIADGHLDWAERSLPDSTDDDTAHTSGDDTAADTTRSDAETGDVEESTLASARESLGTAREGIARTRRVVDDLSRLTRLGQTVRPEEYEWCSLSDRADAATADTDLAVAVTRDARIEADPDRLEFLLDRAGTFAVANGASRLRLTATDDGFAVADDGDTVPRRDTDALFAYGDAVPDAETGMLLPTVGTLARVHGWRVEPDPDYRDGVRYTIHGVSVDPAPADTDAASDSERATGL